MSQPILFHTNSIKSAAKQIVEHTNQNNNIIKTNKEQDKNAKFLSRKNLDKNEVLRRNHLCKVCRPTQLVEDVPWPVKLIC